VRTLLEERRRNIVSTSLLEILKILLRDESLAGDIDIQALAKKTESFSGSDLKRECQTK
jgi:SpoVK/Ycf46/Vps4 family AAA+-type ATPase